MFHFSKRISSNITNIIIARPSPTQAPVFSPLRFTLVVVPQLPNRHAHTSKKRAAPSYPEQKNSFTTHKGCRLHSTAQTR